MNAEPGSEHRLAGDVSNKSVGGVGGVVEAKPGARAIVVVNVPEAVVTPAASRTVLVDPPEQGVPGTREWFEEVYRDAAGELAGVPWARGATNPCLLSWLNVEASAKVRPGSRAIVVGCGLGDDVVELLNRGYDACGFDVSATAITWARQRFPDRASAFLHADLMSLPARYRHRFELVVEVNTLQAVHPSQREIAAQAIGDLCGPRGVVVAVCRGRDESVLLETVQGPPWPLASGELAGLMEVAGLKPSRGIDDFEDECTPPVRRLRGVFERA